MQVSPACWTSFAAPFSPRGGAASSCFPPPPWGGKNSRVVPTLGDTAIVVPRADVHYVSHRIRRCEPVWQKFPRTNHGHDQHRPSGFQRRIAAKSQANESGRCPTKTERRPSRCLSASPGRNAWKSTKKPLPFVRLSRSTNGGSRSIFTLLTKTMSSRAFFMKRPASSTDDVGEVSQVDYINNLTYTGRGRRVWIRQGGGHRRIPAGPVLQPGRGGLLCQRSPGRVRESAGG
jgi:hypothetical protein